jgi:hypothetical protein
MSTVTIEQARVQLNFEQLIQAIQSLDAGERRQVRAALDREWGHDLDGLLREVRARYAAHSLSEDELVAEIEAARVEYHARRR